MPRLRSLRRVSFLLIAAIFFNGYGGGVFLRRGFRVFAVGVAVLVVVQLSDGRFCAVSVLFARLSLGRVKGFAPARS